MNRLQKTLLLIFVLLFVTGCNTLQRSGSGAGAPTSTLAKIQQRGELILGTSGNMPPMTQKRGDGQVVGFDIDLASVIATGMDVELSVKTLPFEDLLPALERGEVDLVISNLTITPKRNLKVAFVGPYLTSGKCIVTKREGLARAEKAEDLNTPATRIAAMKGSTSEQFVKVLLPRATLTLTEDQEQGVKLVSDDRVGGMLTDYPICLSVLQRHPDAGFVSVFSLLTYEPIGIALPGYDPLFVNWTENFLNRLDETHTLDALGKRWFGRAGLSGESE